MQTHKLTLDMQKKSAIPPEIVVRVGDHGTQVIEVTLTSGGLLYVVQESATVRLQIKRSDGGLVRAKASKVSDGVYKATVPGQAFAYHGISRLAYFAVYDGDELVETSQDFRIIVLPGTTEEVAVKYYDQELNDLIDKFDEQTTDVATNEAQRVQNEIARQTKEEEREQAEAKREESEATRQSQEETRQTQEEERQAAERSRVAVEERRVTAETERKQAESTRSEQEVTRQAQEAKREESEATRNDNEDQRIEAENKREEAEKQRSDAETAREEAEQGRNAAETARDEAEQKRQDYYVDIQEKVDDGAFNGGTFLPDVSEDGVISWSNDKGLPNPQERNIMGPPGPEGPSGFMVEINGIFAFDLHENGDFYVLYNDPDDPPGFRLDENGDFYAIFETTEG